MTKEWWPGCIIYEIYPRSFADSNGDGVGDLPGIRQRLSYIKNLGVDAIWIAPFFTSPMADFGYDISDYCDVDKVFGTMQDFKYLLADAHAIGLRVLIDLVLSHTSIEHPWFQESQLNRDNKKSDWYAWTNPRDDTGFPNDWISVFGGPAWTWNENRKQYYLHHFLKEQPQLNLYNPDVRAELFNVARFWLDLGVDGFRLDAVDFYMHDRRLINNPMVPETAMPKNEFGRQVHLYDMMLKEPTLDFIRGFRKVLDEYGEDRIIVGEISSQAGAFTRIGTYTGPGLLNAAYTLDIARGTITPKKLIAVYEEMAAVSSQSCVCWNFSNHDTHRTVSRHATGSREKDFMQAKMFAVLRLFLPGMDCLFQGEELGLPDAVLAQAEKKDPVKNGRDASRTPIPWTHASAYGGFSDVTPWLPVPASHIALAVDAQEKDADSLLTFYRRAFEFKHKHKVLREGQTTFVQEGDILIIARKLPDDEMVASLNFGGSHAHTQAGIYLPPFGFQIQRNGERLTL